METTTNNKKTWEKPAVQTLNINKDTYSGKGNKEPEAGTNASTKNLSS